MPRRISRAQIIMIVAFLAAALYFGFRVFSNRDDGKLRASGTIEAVEVNVSPETAGKVKEALVEEGQPVKVGDPVIEFDLPLLEEKAKSTLTPVVISNMDEIKELIKLSGSVTVGETPVIRIKK